MSKEAKKMRIVVRLTEKSKYWPGIGHEGDNCFWEWAALSQKNADAAVEAGDAEYRDYNDELLALSGYNEAKGTNYETAASLPQPPSDDE